MKLEFVIPEVHIHLIHEEGKCTILSNCLICMKPIKYGMVKVHICDDCLNREGEEVSSQLYWDKARKLLDAGGEYV
jgi:hypothetical protein